MHKRWRSFTVEDETSRKLDFLDISIIRNNDNSFSTFVYRRENLTPQYNLCKYFCAKKQKLKIIRCIKNRAIKICSVDCLDEELDNIYKKISSLGYPAKLITKTIKANQTKMNSLPIFDPHPCPVYLRHPFMGV